MSNHRQMGRKRRETARKSEKAREFIEDENALWTDGSKL